MRCLGTRTFVSQIAYQETGRHKLQRPDAEFNDFVLWYRAETIGRSEISTAISSIERRRRIDRMLYDPIADGTIGA